MPHAKSRRDFLKQSSLAGVGFWVGGSAVAESKSANEKINFACIGVGGKGRSDTAHVGMLGNIVALCDIDDKPLGQYERRFPKAKKYHDFRKMLEEMDKQIDAVTVSTPDHTHAPAAAMAIRMGKHVYCQKPMTHSVYEARRLRELAAEKKVATQMGNQGTASTGLKAGVKAVQEGVIGDVTEVYVWTNRPTWPQSPRITQRPSGTPPVPDGVHWDEWLGPAPERPYNRAYHPRNWRGWWDFGTGALGDMGCHTANMPFMALKLEYPTSIHAENEEVNPETCPGWAKVTYEFPARGNLPPVKVVWCEGRKDGKLVHPPEELKAKLVKPGENFPSGGSVMIGTKGIVFSANDYGGTWELLPRDKFADFEAIQSSPIEAATADVAMKRDWVEGMRSGKPTMTGFEYAGPLTEFILLGNVAMRVGRKMEWDGYNMRSPNCPEAEQYIKREYRDGWTL